MTPTPQDSNRPATVLAVLAVAMALGVFAVGWWLYEAPPEFAPAPAAPHDQPYVKTDKELIATVGGPEVAPDRAGPPAHSGAAEVQASATIDVRLTCAGMARERHVHFFAGPNADHELGSAERNGAQNQFAAMLRVPVDQWLLVGARVHEPADAAVGIPVAPTWVRLGRGEQRLVELQCGESPITLRVVGPSPELLPRLAVLLRPSAAPPRLPGQQFALPLDAEGRARCYLPDETMRATLAIRRPANAARGSWPRDAEVFPLRDGNGEFDLAAGEGELVLSLVEPIVGIAVGAPGHEQDVSLSLEPLPLDPEVEPLFLCSRTNADAAATLNGWTEELGPFTRTMTDVRSTGDLWFVDPRLVQQLGTLLAHVEDAPEPGSVLDLLAEAIDVSPQADRTPKKLDRARGVRTGALAKGTYRLLWVVGGGPGPVAAEMVLVSAGDTTELTLQPPPLQRWTMHLRNVDTAHAEALFLKLGATYGLGAARKGEFLMDRFEAPRVGDTGEVFAWVLKCSFPASVVSVDAGSLRAEVTSTVTDATWCRLRAQAMAGGRVRIRLQRTDGVDSKLPAFLDGDIDLPLLPNTSRSGCVMEDLEGHKQLVAWFQISPTTPDQLVRGSGRWTTLRIDRPLLSAQIWAEGPEGMDAMSVFSVQNPGEYQLFVADGTRRFHIDLEPGGRQTFDATLPIVVR
jgi:hypothetical protein